MQANHSHDSDAAAVSDERLCPNCGAPLKGPYCYACGQPTRTFIRALPGLVREIANDTLYYDSRMWRTLKMLMLRPGALSREYVFGRRARFTSPVRLYLVSSIFAFLMVGLVIDTENVSMYQGNTGDTSAMTAQEPEPPNIWIDGERWQPNGNPIEISWLGESGNLWLNRQMNKLIENSNEAARNPHRFVRTTLGMLPQTMFVLLPLFAGIVSLLYLFARRYYIEHLLLQVHNHSFIFLTLTGLYLLAVARTALADADFITSSILAGTLSVAAMVIWLWIPVYLFVSLKHFYQQGWILTTIKFMTLGWVYFMLLTFALVAVIILGVLRL